MGSKTKFVVVDSLQSPVVDGSVVFVGGGAVGGTNVSGEETERLLDCLSLGS